jgi:hypothetical protein
MNVTDPPPSFLFAHEIESSMIALVWHALDYVATLKRELDPMLHFTQAHLRHLLEAIELSYREMGVADFASVVQILRELGQFEACGGLLGINAVFEQGRYGFSSPEAERQVFTHYLEMLKAYAANRASDSPRAVYHFSGGKGTVFQNKVKRRESDPDFVGAARIRGRSFSVRAWIASDGSFINFSLYPEK